MKPTPLSYLFNEDKARIGSISSRLVRLRSFARWEGDEKLDSLKRLEIEPKARRAESFLY